MAKYKHISSGAVVEVRDDKVMDGEWESISSGDGDKPKRGPGRPRKSE